jgi:hypothetical protein
MYERKQWTVQPEAIEPQARPSRKACLVSGCSCKDARIVSHRRAAFFAAVARTHGETADRMIAPDPEWHLPLLVA